MRRGPLLDVPHLVVPLLVAPLLGVPLLAVPPLVVLPVLVAPATARAEEAGPPRQAMQSFFRWWDELGYPDLGTLPFVRYRPGWGQAQGGLAANDGWDQGFLLADDGTTFTVFGTDLRRRTWTRTTGEDRPPWARVEHEPADLVATVTEGLASLSAVPQGIRSTLRDPFVFERRTGPRARWRVLVLARACAARGRDDLARELLAWRARASQDAASATASLVETWKAELAWAGKAAAEERLEDPGASLEDVRAEFQRWVTGHDAEMVSRASCRALCILDRMLCEEAHAARAQAARPAPPASDPDAQIVALIADLRALGEARLMDRGTARVGGHAPRTAAERLRALGWAAVPRLIEALHDDAFTRTLERTQGRFHREARPLHVRDAALAILDDVSYDALDQVHGTARTTPQSWVEAREAVHRWWSEARVRGERWVLEQAAARGDPEAVVALRATPARPAAAGSAGAAAGAGRPRRAP